MEHPERAGKRKDVLAILALLGITVTLASALLIHSLLVGPPATSRTISEINSAAAAWENRTVKVTGTIRTPLVGIIYPFNYWLYDTENETVRIGVEWLSDMSLSGKNVTVTGTVTRGYAWVHPDYLGSWIYFINATSVQETP